MLTAALRNGPQMICRNGVETAVLISLEEWRDLLSIARPNLKEFLLGPGPRFELNLSRRRSRRRRQIDFGD
jgi:antitoxin Phd